MDREEPRPREPARPGAPVSERYVENEDQYCNCPDRHMEQSNRAPSVFVIMQQGSGSGKASFAIFPPALPVNEEFFPSAGSAHRHQRACKRLNGKQIEKPETGMDIAETVLPRGKEEK